MATQINLGSGVGALKSITYSLTPIDAAGNPSQIEAGTLKLNVVQGGTVSGEILADGNVKFDKAPLAAGEAVSVTKIQALGDADLTSGEAIIFEEFTFVHVAPQAVGFGVNEVASEVEADPATDVPADGVIGA